MLRFGCISFFFCCAFSSVSAQESNKISMDAKYYKSLETFAKAFYYLHSMYVDKEKVSPDKLVEYAIEGIVKKLDPHTMHLNREAFSQLKSDTQGKYGGLGIIIKRSSQGLKILAILDESPAKHGGLQIHDVILSINGKKVADIKLDEAMDIMRGLPGTKLNVEIKRKNRHIDFTLVRRVIKMKSVSKEFLAQNILYIKISSFQDDTSKELRHILNTYEGKTKGLILDLRDNPGGLLDQAIKVADLFIGSGILVSTVGRNMQKIEREFATKAKTYADFSMITLINAGSASASEIVAGALKEHRRSLIIGVKSFGKGSVQTLLKLPDQSALKLTVARYYTPKDRSIQAKGIMPDLVVARDNRQVASSKTEQDLSGHIESQDLREQKEDESLLIDAKKWPEHLQSDNQLLTAYLYLRGLSGLGSFNSEKKGSG